LAWTTQPASGVAGTDLTPVVAIRDAYGNTVTSDNTSVITLTIQTNPGSSTLAGDVDLTVASGVATWTATQAMYLNKSGTGYVLRASDGTRTADSNSFNVTPAAASALAWTTQPASGAAGVNLTPVVAIRDAYGNTITSDNSSVITLTIQTNPGSSTLAGDVDLTVVSGVATWTATQAMYLNKSGTGYVLRASDGTRTADSASFNVTPATANALAWTTQPASGSAGTNLTPVVAIQDSYGNTITTDNTSVITLTIQTNPGSSTLAGDVDLTVVSGVATWTAVQAMYLNKSGTGYVLRASDGTRTADSGSFNVTHAAASTMVYTTQPANTVAGNNLLPVIEIRDTYGNVVTSGADATASVTLTLQSGTGSLSGTTSKNAAAGVASFTATEAVYVTSAGAKTLRATKADTTGSSGTGTLTVDSNSFTISSAAANSIAFTTQPASGIAGSILTPVVTISDVYGNPITSGADASATVTLTLQSGTGALSGTTALNASSGVATWTGAQSMYVNLIGSKVLRATKADTSGSGGTGTMTADSNSFTISHAPASQVVYTTAPTNGQASSATFSLVLEIRDTYGNLVSTGADATANVTLSTPTKPGNLTNNACNASGVVAALSGTTTVPASGGIVTYTGLSLNVGGSYVIRATKADTSGSGGTASAQVDSSSFSLVPGVVTALYWEDATGAANDPETARTAGQVFTTGGVVACDAVGNTATNSTDTIVFDIDDANNPTGDTLHGTVSTTLSSGVANLSSVSASIYLVGTGYKLLATDSQTSATTSTASGSVDVSAATWTQMVFTQLPTTWPDNVNAVPSVKAQVGDAYGNLRTSGCSGAATLSLASNPGGTLNGTLSGSRSGCTYTWADVRIDVASTLSGFTLSAITANSLCNSGSSTCTGTSASFSVTTSAGVDLEHAIELLDVPVYSRTNATTTNMSRIGSYPGSYAGTVTYNWEAVATNTHASNSYSLYLRGNDNVDYATITVPANTTAKTRFNTSFTAPPSSVTSLRIRFQATAVNGNVTAWSSRMVLNQTNAFATKLYVPLMNSLDSTSIVANSTTAPIDSTTSTTATQGDSNYYALWEYDSSLFDQIPTSGVQLQVLISSDGTGTAYASLWDKTDNVQIGSETSITSATISMKTLTYDPSQLTTGHDYEVRIRSSVGTSPARIWKAGLWITLYNLTKFATYWRVSPFMTSTDATYISENARTRVDTAEFSSPVATFECSGASPTGSQTIDLVHFGTSDSGTGSPTVITSSALTMSTTKDIMRSASLTLPSGYNQYLARINGSSGTSNINMCRLIISK
ncbi:MAG: hypothetical protein IT288_15010, partial [Bdellovibrionales bacterium]|nr:hypothetical protein [Bdellovibrionales bacterium]